MKNKAFCTYFNKNYLLKGLCLYNSFIKHNPEAVLWILCFDDESYQILRKLKLEKAKLIKLEDFEDDELRKIKGTRNSIEYYWTCTPSLPLYVLKKTKAEYAVYLDADLFFFSKIDPVFEELSNNSIYTVEHRYPKGEEGRVLTTGRFNVGFQVFRNDEMGINCLNRWREQCIEWCYWRLEDGKLGDQMYLNEWPELYDRVVVSKNLGVNCGPWNIAQYKVSQKGNYIFINFDKLISYHFHKLVLFKSGQIIPSLGYILPNEVRELIYPPYIKEMKDQLKRLKAIGVSEEMFTEKVGIFEWIKSLAVALLRPYYWGLKVGG